MTIKRFLFALALPLMLLAGCAKDGGGQDTPGGEIDFTIAFAGMTDPTDPQTRVSISDAFANAWEDDDKIGVFAVAENVNYIENVALTYNNGTWTAPALYWPQGVGSLDFYAYYPYDEDYDDPDDINAFLVASDQTGDGFKSSVVMTAEASGVARGNNVSLMLSHTAALVQFKVDDAVGLIDLATPITVTLRGVNPAPLATDPVAAVDVTMHRVATTDPTAMVFRALVAPQTLAAGKRMFYIEQGAVVLQSSALTDDVTLSAGRVTSFTQSSPVITIETQPTSIPSIIAGDIDATLTVVASIRGGGTAQYQWYSATSVAATDGELLSGATDATFDIPPDLTPSTYYYFCMVSYMDATPVRSAVATVIVIPPVITIETRPASVLSVIAGDIDATLTVMTSVTGGGTAQYKWYYNNSATNVGGTPVSDPSTVATFAIPTGLTLGTHYYFCEVSATHATPLRSAVATVIVSNAVPQTATNGRITWDGSKYILTTDPRDAGLYFKFGSVVGIFSSGNGGNQLLPGSSGDEFDAGDMAWSPVDVTDNWNLVPYSPGVNIDDAYHTVANVKAGTGDPCRLVGLDLAAIKTANESTLTADDIDNGIWRLPTNDENVAFIDLYKSFSGWQTLGGVNGHKFPNEDTFLPAAGSRTTSGTVSVQGSYGYYWTSAKYSYWHYLFFSSTTVISPQTTNYTAGHSVRCVRQ